MRSIPRSITLTPTRLLTATALVVAGTWGGTTWASSAAGPGKEPAPSFNSRAAAAAGAALVYKSRDFDVAANQPASAVAKCPKGYKVVGGGVGIGSTSGIMNDSRPWDLGDADSVPDDGWLGWVINPDSVPITATTYAVCKKS